MKEQSRDLALFTGCLLIPLLFYYSPFLRGELAFYRNDVTAFFEPFCRYIGAALAAHRFPLWNSLSFCGMPQIAVVSPSVFYPAHIFLAFMPFSQWLAATLLLHQLLAGVGTYLLMGSSGLGRAPS